MSKVISFRTTDEIYNYFKNLDEPFSKSIPPILLDHIERMKNKGCIQGVYAKKNENRYQTLEQLVDELIKRKNSL